MTDCRRNSRVRTRTDRSGGCDISPRSYERRHGADNRDKEKTSPRPPIPIERRMSPRRGTSSWLPQQGPAESLAACFISFWRDPSPSSFDSASDACGCTDRWSRDCDGYHTSPAATHATIQCTGRRSWSGSACVNERMIRQSLPRRRRAVRAGWAGTLADPGTLILGADAKPCVMVD